MNLLWILGIISLGPLRASAEDFRLPESLIPTHYHLRLQPILDETPGYTRFTAPGTVTITVDCTEDTSTIKLNSLDITIKDDIQVTDLLSTAVIPILQSGLDLDNQFLIIELNGTLKSGGQYDIFIPFETPVSQSRLDGMYLDQYVDPATNETKYVATTLFAAISARRCFPCFDEPQLKAVFSVELVRKDGYHSLSNRHQISTEPLDGMEGWYVDKFAPSLRMATYLVAMIVSDMTYEEAPRIESPMNENTTIRIYAPYYFINRGGGVYAANHTQNVLVRFEEYFDSAFMVDKLDSVSLPRFFFNAMENWALITYNDRVLLYFPGETTEQERYKITNIVVHEVVHHYFGNLVTCEWWTWIWLNEGFATYFRKLKEKICDVFDSNLGVEMTYPEFNPWDRFVTDVYQVAMEFDSSAGTHPVANEPTSIADIGGIYDRIAYEKGASLLRMAQSFLTENVMQAAIRKYLKTKQFTNARQDELFELLQEAAEELGKTQPATVKEIMDSWTLQSGYPVIKVSRLNSTDILITQERFQSEPSNSTLEGLWWIPISIRVISPEKEYFLWMSNTENETTFSIPDTETFIVNTKSEGYYRTLYSQQIFDSISTSEDNCLLDSKSKAKLIDDYIAFEEAGLVDSGSIAVISEQLCLENENLMVWETLLKYHAKNILQVYRTHEYKTDGVTLKLNLEKHLLPIINQALKRLESESNKKGENAMLYTELTFWTCFLNSNQPTCNNQVIEKMDKWIDATKDEDKPSSSPFPVDLEETMFCEAASKSDTYWEQIYHYMERKQGSAAKSRIANSLLCTSNQVLLDRVIPHLKQELKEFAKTVVFSKSTIRTNDLSWLHSALRLVFNENARNAVVISIHNGAHLTN